MLVSLECNRHRKTNWQSEEQIKGLTKQLCQVDPMNIAYSPAVQTEEKAPALRQLNALHFGLNGL